MHPCRQLFVCASSSKRMRGGGHNQLAAKCHLTGRYPNSWVAFFAEVLPAAAANGLMRQSSSARGVKTHRDAFYPVLARFVGALTTTRQ